MVSRSNGVAAERVVADVPGCCTATASVCSASDVTVARAVRESATAGIARGRSDEMRGIIGGVLL
jgi:hypothetical protein